MATYETIDLLVEVARRVVTVDDSAGRSGTSNIVITPGLTLTRQEA